jgi:hypothetical protein
MMKRHAICAGLAAATALIASSAIAENVTGQDRIDRCLESINVIGASMGHVERTGPDGKSVLHFVVRSNGAEYDVKCETDTGMVKDVSAHIREAASTN